MFSRRSCALLALVVLVGLVVATVPASTAPAKTLDNLMAAYNGESNANAKYTEFAKKADQEGYAGVAALFRAAANAEKVHATGHAEVIKELGGTPKADIKPPVVGATADNVRAALAGESYERDTMYPEFIKEATASGVKNAVRAFKRAIAAEAEHAKLYSAASTSLPSWKTAKSFYVCPVCGKTVETVTFDKCPVCFTGKDKFNKVG